MDREMLVNTFQNCVWSAVTGRGSEIAQMRATGSDIAPQLANYCSNKFAFQYHCERDGTSAGECGLVALEMTRKMIDQEIESSQ